MANGGRGVNGSMDNVRDSYCLALRLTGGIAQPVGDRKFRFGKNLGRFFYSLSHRYGLAINHGGRTILYYVFRKPGTPQDTGIFCLGNPFFIDVDCEFHVITYASTEGARGIFDNFNVIAHRLISPLNGIKGCA